MIPRLIAAFVRVFLCADVMASILMGFVWRGFGKILKSAGALALVLDPKNTSDCAETDLFSS